MKLRIDRTATALAAAIVLAYASVAEAQDTRNGQAPRTDRASAQAPTGAAAMRDVRMSELIGMSVRNSRGERLGEVNDVVVDAENGRVSYAVLGIGGFLGIGEKLSAFPMSAFKVATGTTGAGGGVRSGDRVLDNDGVKGDRGPIGSDRTPSERAAQGKAGPLDNDGVRGDKGPIGSDRPSGTAAGTPVERGAANMLSGRGLAGMHLVIDADPERLKRAPNFERNQWPDWNDSKMRGEIDRAAGTTGAPKAGRLVRGSQLLDADIRDPNRKNVGEIEDIVVDTRNGSIRYAVVDFDQAWTPDDKLVAIPMRSLRPARENGELVFSGDRTVLERAPSFDKGKWPDLNGGTYRRDVDRYLSSGTGRAGVAPGAAMTDAPTDRSAGTAARAGAAGGGRTDATGPTTAGTPGTGGPAAK